MTTAEAARLLDLPSDSTSEQLETRFLELRRRLEDKIAKAPTPGLQAKYRTSLADITAAFEHLTLEADSSDLPVLQRSMAKAGSGSGVPPPTRNVPELRTKEPPLVGAHTTQRVTKSNNREFIIVAIIAVSLLAGGGWYVLKTREEAALAVEEARRAALRLDEKINESTRRLNSVSKLKANFDDLMRDTERAISDLKNSEREAAKSSGWQAAYIQQERASTERFLAALKEQQRTNPAWVAIENARGFINAKKPEQAEPELGKAEQALTQLPDLHASDRTLLILDPLWKNASEVWMAGNDGPVGEYLSRFSVSAAAQKSLRDSLLFLNQRSETLVAEAPRRIALLARVVGEQDDQVQSAKNEQSRRESIARLSKRFNDWKVDEWKNPVEVEQCLKELSQLAGINEKSYTDALDRRNIALKALSEVSNWGLATNPPADASQKIKNAERWWPKSNSEIANANRILVKSIALAVLSKYDQSNAIVVLEKEEWVGENQSKGTSSVQNDKYLYFISLENKDPFFNANASSIRVMNELVVDGDSFNKLLKGIYTTRPVTTSGVRDTRSPANTINLFKVMVSPKPIDFDIGLGKTISSKSPYRIVVELEFEGKRARVVFPIEFNARTKEFFGALAQLNELQVDLSELPDVDKKSWNSLGN